MANYEVRPIPLYTEEDTWARVMPDKTVKIGITDYAQQMLKEIMFVELPEVGDKVTQMDSFGNAESTKAVSPIICLGSNTSTLSSVFYWMTIARWVRCSSCCPSAPKGANPIG